MLYFPVRACALFPSVRGRHANEAHCYCRRRPRWRSLRRKTERGRIQSLSFRRTPRLGKTLRRRTYPQSHRKISFPPRRPCGKKTSAQRRTDLLSRTPRALPDVPPACDLFARHSERSPAQPRRSRRMHNASRSRHARGRFRSANFSHRCGCGTLRRFRRPRRRRAQSTSPRHHAAPSARSRSHSRLLHSRQRRNDQNQVSRPHVRLSMVFPAH